MSAAEAGHAAGGDASKHGLVDTGLVELDEEVIRVYVHLAIVMRTNSS